MDPSILGKRIAIEKRFHIHAAFMLKGSLMPSDLVVVFGLTNGMEIGTTMGRRLPMLRIIRI